MLELCVDSRDTLRDPRGIGRYVREVLRRVAAIEGVRLTLVVGAVLPVLLRKRYRSLLGTDRFRLARAPIRCDVFWHPWNGTFYQTRAPSVATIHDVVPFAYPEPDEGKRAAQQGPFLRSAQSTAILTDSEFSAGEIVRYLRVPRERVAVVPLAVEPSFSPGPASVPAALSGKRYILVVATSEPHKNLSTLVEGFRRARLPADVVLAVRGGIGASLERVIAINPVGEGELRDLYRGAMLVAAPGVYEGFGLPALEAMACGAPVLASRAGALPEVCGGAAAYVDAPTDATAWAHAFTQLGEDRERLAAMHSDGPARAASFTWERTAEATLTVLRACARADAAHGVASVARS